jgi:amidase
LALAVMADRPSLAPVGPPKQPLRIAVSTRPVALGMPVNREFARAVIQTGELLAAAGHRVRRTDPGYPPWLGPALMMLWFGCAESSSRGLDPELLEPRTRQFVRAGRLARRLGLVRPQARTRWLDRLNRFFDHHDVLVTPVLAGSPPAAVAWSMRGFSRNVAVGSWFAPFAPPWNLAQWPCASVPAGLHPDNGMPIAVQLIARPGHEDLLLAVAAQLEIVRPWPRLAPGLDRAAAH